MYFKEICAMSINTYYERTSYAAIRTEQQYINPVRIYISPSIERNSHRLNIPTFYHLLFYFNKSLWFQFHEKVQEVQEFENFQI